MPQRTSYDHLHCSVAKTLDVVGDAWSLLVVRDLLLGITRFELLQRDLGVSRKVLADRLAKLAEQGIVERVPYQDNPPRHDHVLTEKGLDLAKVLAVMIAWGDKWVTGEDRAPVLLHHVACGHDVRAEVTCPACKEPLRVGEAYPVPGPGFAATSPEVPRALERLSALLSGS